MPNKIIRLGFLIKMSVQIESNKAIILRKDRLLENSTGIVGVLIFLFCIGRLFWLADFPDAELIKFVPDDAFYYIVLAKNFSLVQRWTFDGQAPASGFHLLWGYLLAAIFAVFPAITWKILFVVTGVFGSVAYSVAASLVAATLKKLIGVSAVYGVVFVFLGGSSITQPAMLMEAPLVSLFAAALFYIACREVDRVGAGHMLFAGAVGLLGMLSRSDFGLLPLILFCVSVSLRNQRMTQVTLSALLGAVIGLALVVAHTYWLSGELAPASAQMKSHWAQVDGASIKPGYKILLALAVPFFSPWEEGLQSQYGFLVLLTLLGFAMYVALTHKNRRKIFPIFISAVFVIAGYLFLYRHNGALQIWYGASFLVPLSLLFGVATSALCFRLPLLAVLLLSILSAYSWRISLNAPWPWQSSMLKGGLYLKKYPIEGSVGAWNAGIISWFSERQIVNLDGLVNDEVLQYAKSGRLSDYVAKLQITYVMDFPFMLSSVFSASHGYSDGKLNSCLIIEYEIPSASPAEQFGGKLTLYKVRDNCLR